MAKYTSSRYPNLRVHTPSGPVRFVDGEFETTDKDVIAVLDNLPADDGVAKASSRGGSSKSDDK